MRYADKYMDFVMTPPVQEQVSYDQYIPQVSTMRIVQDAKMVGLGEIPVSAGSDSSQQSDWVMPVVVIVVSAMALMTLYAVLSDRKK